MTGQAGSHRGTVLQEPDAGNQKARLTGGHSVHVWADYRSTVYAY
jgi:hypothetical protein